MNLDRATTQQLTTEIVALLGSTEGMRTHYQTAIATLVALARNMAEHQIAAADELSTSLEKNIEALAAIERGMLTKVEEIREVQLGNVEQDLIRLVTAAKGQFTAEVLKLNAKNLSAFNEEVVASLTTIFSSRLQAFSESKQVERDAHEEATKRITKAADAAMARIAAITKASEAASDRLEGAIEAMSRRERERELEKGFFRKLKELFFGEAPVVPPAQAKKSSR